VCTKLKHGIHYDLVSEGVQQWKILLKICVHFDWCSVFVHERKYTENNFSVPVLKQCYKHSEKKVWFHQSKCNKTMKNGCHILTVLVNLVCKGNANKNNTKHIYRLAKHYSKIHECCHGLDISQFSKMLVKIIFLFYRHIISATDILKTHFVMIYGTLHFITSLISFCAHLLALSIMHWVLFH